MGMSNTGPGGTKNISVLMIEDNPGDARLIKEALTDLRDPDFELEWAKCLLEGIESLKRKTPGMILLDLSLPDSHGFDTIARVRKEFPIVPLVVLTGLNDENVGLKAVQLGAQDYIIKGTVEGVALSRIIRYAIERKRIEEALRESEERLKRKNHEIREFTDVVTHDLKKPLASIKTIHDLVAKEAFGKLNDQGSEAMGICKDAINYMQELLQDLLTCASLEAETVSLEREKLDMKDIAEQVFRRFSRQMEEKGIRPFNNAETYACADRKAVMKLMMNLIGNSINYIGEGGKREITVGSMQKNGTAVFFVKDTGIGIPEESQGEIFQKFKRGKNALAISGTGLGLAIVKGTVLAHGGEIWIESKVDDGTTVYFTLPDGAKAQNGENAMPGSDTLP